MLKNEIIFFETKDKEITLPVQVNQETVWLNRNQIAELFGRDVKTIGKHINNALREELEPGVAVAKFATTTPHGAIEGKSQTHQVEYYNLDMILFPSCQKGRLTHDRCPGVSEIVFVDSKPKEQPPFFPIEMYLWL